MDFDLFVIGGGSAGVRCARISAGHGARVGIAEERYWGGTCVNIGCVPKKLLVQAGEYGGWAEDAAGFGWTIHKGPHDWGKLIAAKDREITRLEGIYRKLLSGAGATVFDGRAVFVDPHTIEVAGKRVTAEKIVIATGGHPERPRHSGRRTWDHFGRCVLPEDDAAARGHGRVGLYRGRVRRHFPRAGRRGASGLPPAAAVARLRPRHQGSDGRGAGGAGHHPASQQRCRRSWRPTATAAS